LALVVVAGISGALPRVADLERLGKPMKNELLIAGALANCGGCVSTEELLAFLKSQTKGIDYFRLSPPPGSTMGAALDWQAVLGVTASTLAIGQALWAVYVKFVRPKRKQRPDAFLYVVIKTENRRFVQFTIGRDHDNQEQFIQEFTEKAEKLRVLTPDTELVAEKHELRVSEIWKKV
jgi:hypothetical protein